jgi:hypothetical protein
VVIRGEPPVVITGSRRSGGGVIGVIRVIGVIGVWGFLFFFVRISIN